MNQAAANQDVLLLEQLHNQLEGTISSFVDRRKNEQAARDQQFERRRAWARKVSKKTGIPLENL